MTIQKLTGDLQNLCHSGFSQYEVRIKILDAYYDIGDIKLEVSGKHGVVTIGGEFGKEKSDNEN